MGAIGVLLALVHTKKENVNIITAVKIAENETKNIKLQRIAQEIRETLQMIGEEELRRLRNEGTFDDRELVRIINKLINVYDPPNISSS